MRVAAVMSDLMLFSRIDAAATAAGASLVRVDTPVQLPHDLDQSCRLSSLFPLGSWPALKLRAS